MWVYVVGGGWTSDALKVNDERSSDGIIYSVL